LDHRWLDLPQLKPIRRDFLPADLKPMIRQNGVDRTIVVQPQHDRHETEWLFALEEENDFIAGVVAWLDLASPDCERQVEEYRRHPKFVGVRHMTHNEADDDFIVREAILRGLKILERHRVPFDLWFFPRHLHHAVTVARMLPELPLVLDHRVQTDDQSSATRQLGSQFPGSGILSQCLLQIIRNGH
jgi:L-fucono-1,5-lactonase